MSLRVIVVLFVVLFGLAHSAKTKEPEQKKQCVDNTLYAKYVCEHQKDGVKILVPGKCSEYYECSKGLSKKKTCSKFFDPKTQKCVSSSTCVEVDDTDCVIPTPPPCSVSPAPPTPAPPSPPTPAPPTPCECPAPPTPPSCPAPPQCPPPTECPAPPTCPPPTECPAPPTCPETPVEPPVEPPTEPTPKPPCPPPSGGPCGNWFDPNDLYGSFVCKGKDDGTKLIVPSNCSDYYYCIGEHSYRKSCGSNMYFDPKIGACDLKSNVECPSERKSPL